MEKATEAEFVSTQAEPLLYKVRERREIQPKLEEELSVCGSDWQSRRDTILTHLPEPSAYRNEILMREVGACYTSWEELSELRQDLASIELTIARAGITSDDLDGAMALLEGLFSGIDLETAKDYGRTLEYSVPELEPLISFLTAEEVRAFSTDFCLGDAGVFLEQNYPTVGRKVFELMLDVTMSSFEDLYDRDKLEIAKDGVLTVIDSLDAGRRTRIFTTALLLIKEFRTAIPEDVFVFKMTESFGALGLKLLQMDSFVPERFRGISSKAKEGVQPLSKLYVQDTLEQEGRAKLFAGLGPCLGSGSMGSVFATRSIEASETSGTCDGAVKVIRPEVLEGLDSDAVAIKAGLEFLVAQGVILDTNSGELVEELVAAVREEADPFFEMSNHKVWQFMRGKASGTGVLSPDYRHASSKHLEISMAPGYSLNELSENPKLCAEFGLSVSEIRCSLAKEFLRQMLDCRIFHSDLHDGNVFVSEKGEITIIDFGQVGIEDSFARRRGLLLLLIGLESQSPRLVFEAMKPFINKDKIDDLKNDLNDTDSIVNTLIQGSSQYGLEGSIVRFLKGASSVIANFHELSAKDTAILLAPYIRRYGITKVLARTLPGVAKQLIHQRV